MKIGIDAHNLEGQRTGVGRYLFNLLKEWIKEDSKFILYFKNEIPKDLPKSDFFENKLLKVSSTAKFIHWDLCRSAKKDKLDILFCPGYIAPIFYRGKIALVLHDIIYQARPELYNWPSWVDKILLKKVSQIAVKKARIIFTCSKFSQQEILRCYQIASDKVFNIPLAADQSARQIDDRDKLAEIKKKYQIKDKFIFYVGSIFNRRHLPETIRAFENTAQRLDNYQFLIVGANHTAPFIDIDGLIKKVNQRLGRSAVLRRDYLTDQDLVLLYNAADLLIYLSDYEGFGLPVLEAMACATPVITSQTASLPEVGDEAVIYVKDNFDIEEISQAIERGLTNEALRQSLIQTGLSQAQKFSWQRCAQETFSSLRGAAGDEAIP